MERQLPPEVWGALQGLGGMFVSTGKAGEMWEFSGKNVAIPFLQRGENVIGWARHAAGMIERIAAAQGHSALHVWRSLTASDPDVPELARFLTPMQLAQEVHDYRCALNRIAKDAYGSLIVERERTEPDGQ